MHVRSDRRHHFAVSPDELWAAVCDVQCYPEWWPWLREFDADALAAGEEWRCRVQPPLPYRVTFTVSILEVVPATSVRAEVRGDIEGTARIEFAAGPDGGTYARLIVDLAPAHRVFKVIGFLAGPVVRRGHDWVLDTGACQFREKALPPGPKPEAVGDQA